MTTMKTKSVCWKCILMLLLGIIAFPGTEAASWAQQPRPQVGLLLTDNVEWGACGDGEIRRMPTRTSIPIHSASN